MSPVPVPKSIARARPVAAAPAFTLVEVLAVMVVMGILLAVGGSALVGTRVGRDVEAASLELRGQLDTARWQAMTHRTRSRLLIVTADNAHLNQRFGRNPALRTYGIARWDSDQRRWNLIGDWTFLDAGKGFLTQDLAGLAPGPWTDSGAQTVTVVAGNQATLANVDLDRDGQLTAADQLAAAWVEFQPDGSVESASQQGPAAAYWLLALADGEVDSNSQFQPRQIERVRPLVIDSQTGLVSLIP